MHLDWSEGHSLTVLCLPPGNQGISAFELHSRLRDTFTPPLTKGLEDCSSDPSARSGLQFSLHLLDAPLQLQVLEALAYLTQTCRWKPFNFSSKKDKPKPQDEIRITVRTSLDQKSFLACTEKALSLGRANNTVRTLTELPSNLLNPGNYQLIAKEIAREHGLEHEFISCDRLEKMGAGAFLAVDRADPNSQSGILKLTYAPKTKNPAKMGAVALVGKGLCFDTGGYNIKTGAGMNGMHRDMSGSAVTLALIAHFAETRAPFPVTAHLALAENLISPTAYKPNEVVTACDGTTIEVADTDAEGRMVLADTLALVRREKPALCIDFATLTGAAIRALDTRIGALFSNRPELAERAITCGRLSGERVWSFPLETDYGEQLKSEIADLLQCTHGTNSDHIYAAWFLSHFIGDEIPWLHLDLTAAKNKGGLGLISSTTTGFGVRWAAEVARHHASESKPGARKFNLAGR
jgi:leucyl aminopeptidase